MILFDIDGTLLHCTDAVHYFAFCDALSWLAGRPVNLDGVQAHGNTDVGILRDALRLAGVEEADWRPRLEETRTRMADFVDRSKGDFAIEVLPGVPDLLSFLRSRGKLLAVATGNLQRIGEAKLRHAGLLDFFAFGAYSDAFEQRRDVFGHAIEKARAAAGTGCRICVVGDTPEDVRAAHANGVDVIAVSTGIFAREELLAERPTLSVAQLTELLIVSAG